MELFKYAALFLIAALSTNTVTCFKDVQPEDSEKQRLSEQIMEVHDVMVTDPSSATILEKASRIAQVLEVTFRVRQTPRRSHNQSDVTGRVDIQKIDDMFEELKTLFVEGRNDLNSNVPEKAKAIEEEIKKQLFPPKKSDSKSSSKSDSKSKSAKSASKPSAKPKK